MDYQHWLVTTLSLLNSLEYRATAWGAEVGLEFSSAIFKSHCKRFYKCSKYDEQTIEEYILRYCHQTIRSTLSSTETLPKFCSWQLLATLLTHGLRTGAIFSLEQKTDFRALLKFYDNAGNKFVDGLEVQLTVWMRSLPKETLNYAYLLMSEKYPHRTAAEWRDIHVQNINVISGRHDQRRYKDNYEHFSKRFPGCYTRMKSKIHDEILLRVGGLRDIAAKYVHKSTRQWKNIQTSLTHLDFDIASIYNETAWNEFYKTAIKRYSWIQEDVGMEDNPIKIEDETEEPVWKVAEEPKNESLDTVVRLLTSEKNLENLGAAEILLKLLPKAMEKDDFGKREKAYTQLKKLASGMENDEEFDKQFFIQKRVQTQKHEYPVHYFVQHCRQMGDPRIRREQQSRDFEHQAVSRDFEQHTVSRDLHSAGSTQTVPQPAAEPQSRDFQHTLSRDFQPTVSHDFCSTGSSRAASHGSGALSGSRAEPVSRDQPQTTSRDFKPYKSRDSATRPTTSSTQAERNFRARQIPASWPDEPSQSWSRDQNQNYESRDTVQNYSGSRDLPLYDSVTGAVAGVAGLSRARDTSRDSSQSSFSSRDSASRDSGSLRDPGSSSSHSSSSFGSPRSSDTCSSRDSYSTSRDTPFKSRDSTPPLVFPTSVQFTSTPENERPRERDERYRKELNVNKRILKPAVSPSPSVARKHSFVKKPPTTSIHSATRMAMAQSSNKSVKSSPLRNTILPFSSQEFNSSVADGYERAKY